MTINPFFNNDCNCMLVLYIINISDTRIPLRDNRSPNVLAHMISMEEWLKMEINTYESPLQYP